MEEGKVDISIIIPLYNTEKYINELLRSIINQTYKNYEVIIVNDGSTDNSFEVCKKIIKGNKKIKIINKNNGGVSSARNLGLKNAKGELIVFVDSDDILDKNYLEKMIYNIKDNDLIICGYYERYSNKKIQKVVTNEIKQLSLEETLNGVMNGNNIKGFLWNKIFRKDIIDKFDLKFDESMNICEDTLFIINYLNYSRKITLIPDCIYYYRMRKSSIVWEKNMEKVKNLFNVYDVALNLYEKKHINNNDICMYNYLCTYFLNRKYIRNKLKFNIKENFIKILLSKRVNMKKKLKLVLLSVNSGFLRKYMKIKTKNYKLYV